MIFILLLVAVATLQLHLLVAGETTRCLPELGYITDVRLSLSSNGPGGASICSNTTGLASSAINRLFVSGITLPSSCTAELFGDIDCSQSSRGTPKGKGPRTGGTKNRTGTKSGKTKGTKGTKGKKGKKKRTKRRTKSRNRARNGQARFDVLVKCNPNPCILEGLVDEETEAKLQKIIGDLANLFTNDFRRSRTSTGKNLLSNDGMSFSARVGNFRKITSFCSGTPRSDFTPRRRNGKRRNRTKLRPLELCGKQ